MSRFIIGDELGNIKSLRYISKDGQCELRTIHQQAGTSTGTSGVQQLATLAVEDENTIIGAAFSDGSTAVFTLPENNSLEAVAQWTESRLTGGKFVGSALRATSMFTCSSNGMLRKTKFACAPESVDQITHQTRALPSRLADWKLAKDSKSFAYGGDEVDLSIWDTELAFSSTQSAPAATSGPAKKRKRNEDLIPGEIWRARNVPNDHLGLRQPVRVTSLTYLECAVPASGHHLVAGTQLGDVRRYDTRAARRPVNNWTGIAKVGGVGAVCEGTSEHELFVSDTKSNLYSIDLRAGTTLYGYKGISGAVISIAPTKTSIASVALDRYCRIHSTVPPPPTTGSNMEQKASVLEKIYLASVPTVIAWDGRSEHQTLDRPVDALEGHDEDGDDIWENMEHVS